jgi:MFS family permease
VTGRDKRGRFHQALPVCGKAGEMGLDVILMRMDCNGLRNHPLIDFCQKTTPEQANESIRQVRHGITMKKIWPFSFYFGAIATMLPYLVLYYGELGLAGRQIGFLTALPPLITLVSAPLWTGVADSTQRHRLVMSLSLLFSIIFILAVSRVTSFWQLLPLVVMFAFAIAPTNPLADSATMNMLEGERENYGRVRLGGTFGWGVASIAAGIVIEQKGLHSSFYMFAILIFFTMLVGQKLKFSKVKSSVSVRHGIQILLGKTRWILFLAMAYMAGVGLAVFNTYLLFYMDELGSSKTLMGITMVVATISEIPIFFFSNRLISRMKAHGLLVFGVAMTGARLLLLAAINQPIGVTILQLMNGLTFSAVWVAGVTYANDNAPRGISATAQGLFGSVLLGFGAATGNFLGGFLIDAFGTQVMFVFFGVLVLGSLAVFSLIEKRLPVENVEPSI